MRRFDKNKNIQKANLLVEQRYLESKGLLKEDNGEMWDRDASHRDTYDDTSYQDNWDENPEMSDEEVMDNEARDIMDNALREMGIDNPLAKHTTFYVDGLNDIVGLLYSDKKEMAIQHAQEMAGKISDLSHI